MKEDVGGDWSYDSGKEGDAGVAMQPSQPIRDLADCIMVWVVHVRLWRRLQRYSSGSSQNHKFALVIIMM